jgi:hypothetical protein
MHLSCLLESSKYVSVTLPMDVLILFVGAYFEVCVFYGAIIDPCVTLENCSADMSLKRLWWCVTDY